MMQNLYPTSFEEKIAFNSIRGLLKNKCISPLGEEEVDNMQFSFNFKKIIRLIDETDEMHRLLHTDSDEMPISNIFDIREALARVRIEGLFLDEGELFNIQRSLNSVVRLVSYIKRQEESLYPNLHRMIENISSFAEITKQLDRILDKFGKIKDNATTELAQINRAISQAQGSASKLLASILKQAQSEGFVEKDVAPTMRDGRLVIPVAPAFKRKIRGIIHDESATGKTVFIEPQQVVEANNHIRELENDKRREIMRILLETTNFLRPHFEEIRNSQYFLGKIDFLRAKSLFADEVNGIKPQIENRQLIEWQEATHPLLHLTLKKQGKKVVPLDISLNEEQRILLISGPNAGGKSVCLKTVVLLQYMLQCGLLIPLKESSKMGVFEQIFIDIGDEQSIENDLSTYSSHLLNIKHFIKNGTDKTLILIDEFGTGTEPQIGGAIAEASLERFNKLKMYGVITTHYTNLKHYAEETEGIINGAMLYDRQHLQPLFQLQIGRPGSSFAVEIARKIGLPEELIADAAEKVGQDHLDYDKHLQDIVRDKRYWERKRQEIRIKEKRLSETLEKYEEELAITDRQRKEISKQAKVEAEQLLKTANAKIENTIRLIKEANAEKELTKKAREELSQFKETVQQEETKDKSKKLKLPKTKKAIKPSAKKKEELQLEAGQHVELISQKLIGSIIEIKDEQAVVAIGNLKTSVKLSDLKAVSNNQIRKEIKYSNRAKSNVVDSVRERKLNFSSEIDVRGMRADEALQAVSYFIDDALMIGVSAVKILHGTGTGALRQVIRQYLSTVQGVEKYKDEHVQFGGAGITIVELE